ncbi:MAG: hypothetical protein ACOC7P_00140 [Chloroflexota bacterium]
MSNKASKTVKVSGEGVVLNNELLGEAGIEGEAEVIVREGTIILKSKGMTERVRGLVRGSRLSAEELERLYHEDKGG